MAQGSLGVLFNNLRGKAGSVVFSQGRDGTTVRPRITGRNPKTAAQLAVRAALSKASTQYKNLTTLQVGNWSNYAQGITKHDPETGRAYKPTPIAAFTALTAKFYQVTPTGTAPIAPPVTGFGGDTITVTCTAGAGQVTFTASAPNAVNVTTELLLQPLRSRNRSPQPKGYRNKAYKAFAVGQLTQIIVIPSGFYVPAIRFVNLVTGQEALLSPLTQVQAT